MILATFRNSSHHQQIQLLDPLLYWSINRVGLSVSGMPLYHLLT